MTVNSKGYLWYPRADDLEHSNVARLMRRHGIRTTEELRAKAARDAEWFYPAIIQDMGIEWFQSYDRVADSSKGLPWTEWFLGGELNIVHNVLDRHLRDGRGGDPAVIAEHEEGRVAALSYSELGARVSRLGGALCGIGVGTGDAVGFYLPMTADVVVALLACLKVGAVPVPVFGGFGPDALAARLVDADCRVLLTADGTMRRGKPIRFKETVDAACELAPRVRTVVVRRRLGGTLPWHEGRDLWWDEFEEGGGTSTTTKHMSSDARSLILYTSGTTGRPKGVVHTHGGVQIVTAKEVGYHLDVRPGDVVFWLTDIGWMMGPWEILGTLFHRGTVVLLDGVPDFPDPSRLWSMVERHRVTHLGVAPTVIRLLASGGLDPVRRHDLASLRVLGSTGEPWDETSYRWFSNAAGGDRCPVINISGGTELMGCLLAPLPTAPIKACSLQGPALGMDVDVLDEVGRSIRGEVGYLVCRNAAPNMTRGFLGDPQRYLDTYFARFGQGIWNHGDWAEIDADGAWFLTGRADDTLKVAGKRVGPGEVEAEAISHPAVREAAAVGLPDPLKGTALVLVAVTLPGIEADEALAEEVSRHIGSRLGPTLRPAKVVWVDALPVTRSGKILRRLIGRALAGEAIGEVATLANPEALAALTRVAGSGRA